MQLLVPFTVIIEAVDQKEMARTIARQIAFHPLSRDPVVDNHLGEAQAMALATRPEFVNDVLNWLPGWWQSRWG